MRQIILDRELSGRLLSKMLESHVDSNSVVFGIPTGGVCVAAEISEMFSLPLEVISCRPIKHPADPSLTIGSVSVKDVLIHDCSHSIPQDYIAHQIAMLRNVVCCEQNRYYGKRQPSPVRYKTVILVDDILETSDAVLACVHEIKKQQPLKLIVAAPVVSAEAARTLRGEVDQLMFLRMERSISSGKDYFIHFPEVTEEKVKRLLKSAQKFSPAVPERSGLR
jgi:putative phosphoribosyl transferase